MKRELPMLAGIAGILRWLEELVNLVSGPLLTLGLAIALIDLLTEGKLLARYEILLYIWATTQAVGVDAQLVASWDRARVALRERRFWALAGLVVLGVGLAYVAWVAAQVFALQESEGLTTAAALARLGMDSAAWLIQRTALSVTLVCLAGWTRYHPPALDVALEAEAERNRLEADLLLEPLRAQKRIMQARGLRGVLAATMGRGTDLNAIVQGTNPATIDLAHGVPSPSKPQTLPQKPPTGPGSPSRSRRSSSPYKGDANDANVVRLPSAKSRPRRAASTSNRAPRISVEDKARAHYKPGMSAGELARAAGIGASAASKYRRILAAEPEMNSAAAQ